MNSSPVSSILIVKTSAIGDVIQAFPAVEYLRSKFPNAQIDWVVEEGIAPLLKSHPLIDHVIPIRTKAWRKKPFHNQTHIEFRAFVKQLRSTSYDLLFDLQGNGKSGVVTAFAKAACKIGFGWRSVREKWNLLATNRWVNPPSSENIRLKYLGLVQNCFESEVFHSRGIKLKISEQEKERLDVLCKEVPNRSGPRLMVCFGSKWPNKRLAEETLLSLLEKISNTSDPSYIFIFADEEEKRFAEQCASHFKERACAVGDLTLPLWQALMWEVDGVIAVDSAALHLCGTTQTPSFSVFGSSSASFYKPSEERHEAVQGPCPYGRVFSARCPVLRTCATGACIRNLQADPLFEAYQLWFCKWCLPQCSKKGSRAT